VRLIAWLGDVLTSRLFWEVRASTLCISLLIIWTGIIMATDMILYTPSEFLPALVVIGLVITVLFTVLRAKTAYNDTVKAKLRSGEIKTAPSFGLDYMSGYVGTIIVGVVGAFVFPGMIYQAIGATPDYAGCIVIALVWSLVVGIKGAPTASEMVDLFRDSSKIKTLEEQASKKTE